MKKNLFIVLILLSVVSCLESRDKFDYSHYQKPIELLKKISLVLFEEYTGISSDDKTVVFGAQFPEYYRIQITANEELEDSPVAIFWYDNSTFHLLFQSYINIPKKKIDDFKPEKPEGLLLRIEDEKN